jgi:hypothetical protein
MRGTVAKAIRNIVYGDNATKAQHKVVWIKNALGQDCPMVVADSVRRYYKVYKKAYAHGRNNSNAKQLGLLRSSKTVMELPR